MKKKLLFTCLVVIGILFAYIYSVKTVYGEWYIENWGTVDGEVVIDSLGEIEGEDVSIVDDTVSITTDNIDPKIYIDNADKMQYVQINISGLETTKDEYFKYYYMHKGKYKEKYSEERKIKEGNNIICFDKPLEGKLRIDFEGLDSVNIHINYIKLDNDVQVVSEFIVCFLMIVLLLTLIVILYIFRKQIIAFIGNDYLTIIIVSSFFAWFLLWSLILPYNSGPDEFMRFDVVKYIYRFRSLPRGDDPILCTANSWGVSYAYSPYLAYLIGAGLMYVAALMGHTGFALFHVARLVSVISSTITIIFLIKISKTLKLKNRYLLPVLVGLLPEFTFISAYVNNDSLAIMSVAIIIYAWIIGLESRWDFKSCVYLMTGMAICVASYYNCYGYLLFSFIGFVSSNIYWSIKEKQSKVIKSMMTKGVFMLLGTISISGWWFIRNYYLYDGDILGSNASEAAAIKYAVAELNPLNKQSLKEQGVTLYEMLIGYDWIRISAKSFVAGFGYMQFFIKEYMYWIVGAIIIIGIILKISSAFKEKKRKMIFFDILLILSSLVVLMLSIIYSYTSDFQAQGRYLLPMLIPMMIFVSYGYNILQNPQKRVIIPMMTVIMILINIYSLGLVIIPAYYW